MFRSKKMAQKSISGTLKLAEKIRARRNELHLTIEEAAKRAGHIWKINLGK